MPELRNRIQWVEDPARMIRTPVLLCSIDPITLTGLALAGAAGAAGTALTSGGGGSAPAPAPAAPPAQPAPAKTPAPKQSIQQPSFIGGVPAPPPSTGQKTLLGQ